MSFREYDYVQNKNKTLGDRKMQVIGFTGQEREIEAGFKTFCNLCNRMINKGEKCLLDYNPDRIEQQSYYFHTDCVVAHMTRMHVVEFKDTVKVKSKTRKTRKTPPKVRQGDGSSFCGFCYKRIEENQTFVKKDKKDYHNEGRNSCVVRYNRVMRGIKK